MSEQPNLVNDQENDTLKKQLEEGQKALEKLMFDGQAKDKQIDDLTSKLASATSKLEELSAKFRDAQLEDAGVNSEQYKKLEQEIERKLEQKFEEQYGSQFSELKSKNSQLESQLHNVTVVTGVMGKYATDAQEATRDILEGIIKQHVHKDPENKDKTFVTDANGNKKLSKKYPGQPMEAEEFIEELRVSRAPLFKPSHVTKSVIQGGQIMSTQNSINNSNTIDGVDINRFKTDPEYYNSIDRSKRAAIALKLGL